MLLFVVSLFPFSTNLYYNTNEFENTARGFIFSFEGVRAFGGVLFQRVVVCKYRPVFNRIYLLL